MQFPKLFPAFVVGIALVAAACDRRPTVSPEIPAADARLSTFETARVTTAVDRYIAAPTPEQAADVEKAFAELDLEIAELDKLAVVTAGDAKIEADSKAGTLRSFGRHERLRYTEAQARFAAETAKIKIQETGHELKEGLKEGALDAKEALKDAGEKVKDKLDDIAR